MTKSSRFVTASGNALHTVPACERVGSPAGSAERAEDHENPEAKVRATPQSNRMRIASDGWNPTVATCAIHRSRERNEQGHVRRRANESPVSDVGVDKRSNSASDTRYGIQGEVRAVHKEKTFVLCERSVLSSRAEPVSEAVARNGMGGASAAPLDNGRAVRAGRPLSTIQGVRAKIERRRCNAASAGTVPSRTCFASDLR
jgi:hypothetical protein